MGVQSRKRNDNTSITIPSPVKTKFAVAPGGVSSVTTGLVTPIIKRPTYSTTRVKSQSGKDILLKNELGFKRAMGTAKRTTADMIFTETEDALSHYKNRLTIVKSKFEWENSLSSMLYIDAQAMAQAWREGHE